MEYYCSAKFEKCDFRGLNVVKDAFPCSLSGYCVFQLPKRRLYPTHLFRRIEDYDAETEEE